MENNLILRILMYFDAPRPPNEKEKEKSKAKLWRIAFNHRPTDRATDQTANPTFNLNLNGFPAINSQKSFQFCVLYFIGTITNGFETINFSMYLLVFTHSLHCIQGPELEATGLP